jgi:hypothetical protein
MPVVCCRAPAKRAKGRRVDRKPPQYYFGLPREIHSRFFTREVVDVHEKIRPSRPVVAHLRL